MRLNSTSIDKTLGSDRVVSTICLIMEVQTGDSISSTLNPHLTNGFSHYYHLGESTFMFRGIRSNF